MSARFLAYAAVFLALSMQPAPAARAAVVTTDLENALMCKCDDNCGKVMINCTCETSKKTREDYRRYLESGLTTEQVIKIYVDKYGETILSAPTKKGFNLAAWLTPFVAILGGGWGIKKIIATWLAKTRAPSGASEAAAPAAGKYSRQLEQELDKMEI